MNTHDELVERAVRWLKSQNCGVAFSDRFQATTWSGEQPDAIGWRSDASILIECKATRSDYLADKKKHFRRSPESGMGDWRFFLCPPGLIKPEELPKEWGLLYAMPKQIKRAHGIPTNTKWHTDKPFKANKHAEMQVMYSALRRFEVRGLLHTVYDKLPVEVPPPASRKAPIRPLLCTMTANEKAAALRFLEATEDVQEYDLPKPMMRRLAKLGLVEDQGNGRYSTTHMLLQMRDELSAILEAS